MSTTSSKYTGLTADKVAESRAQHGSNILSPAHRESLFVKFMRKFRDPLIVILLVAGVLAMGISCYEYWGLGEGFSVFFEPMGIFIAILLATGLAFYFEYRADKEFDLLNQVNDDEPVQVIRDGRATEVPRRDIVVDDIVVITTGNEIPADGKLLEATSLNVDESTLTGEPIAAKSTDPELFDPDATFPTDYVLRGTKVMEGHGVMRVTAVGDATENGKVFEAAQIDDSVKTPLDEQLGRLSRLISIVSYTIAALIVVGRVVMFSVTYDFEWVHFIAYMLESVMIAVALIVVSVPEGLPMAVTLSLAYSMRRMLKTNNLVRKLHACETMGATTVICTDKTGTLTQNRMQVFRTNFYGNPADDIIDLGIAANSTAQLDLTGTEPKVLGNPTEGALILWMRGRGVDYAALRESVMTVEELPFTTERKYMATVVENRAGERFLFVKGAPEIVFGLCAETPGVTRDEIERQLLEYQNMAMRTLGFAYQRVDRGDVAIDPDKGVVARNLTFLGITAISDPVRADVPDAVGSVLNAGIGIKIVTGDTPGTAKEIARQIGLWHDDADGDRNIITGTEFAALSDMELRERVGDMKIIARARPLDKKRLVEALQYNDEVVAVTGDGTNDAPALKAAHVGLSMGDGTSVAKEASDITIVDNSFTSIGRAVMWGRSLYQNIQRFILFQMTVNVVACLIVLCGAFMGTESPLTVTQMLWVNLIMDTFAAMALASLPPNESVMRDKPRSRSAFIITRSMWGSLCGVGVAFFLFLFGLLYIFHHTDITSLTQLASPDWQVEAHGLTPYELSLFFTIFVFLQFWNMFNARCFATGTSIFKLRESGGFITIAVGILAGQIAIVTLGGPFFSVTPLSVEDWCIIIGGTSSVLWIGEMIRLFQPDKE